jgi:long-chain acyl-CoA synthetase
MCLVIFDVKQLEPVKSMNSLISLIDAATSSHDSARPFIVVDGMATNYGQFFDRMSRMYSVFKDCHLNAGARVGIVSHSPLDIALVLLAGFRAGFAMISLNPELTQQERESAIRSAKLNHIFADADLVATIVRSGELGVTEIGPHKAIPTGKGLVSRLLAKKQTQEPRDLHALLDRAVPIAPKLDPNSISGDDTALMLFTSGTTRQPKVVELSHANIAAQIATFQRLYNYVSASRILNPLPLHFTDGLLHGPIVTFLTGATLFRPGKFEFTRTGTLLDTVRQERMTHFIVVPALLSLIAKLGQEYDATFLGKDFQFIRSSGDWLPEPLWKAVQDRFGVRVANTYGMSETVCEALYCGPADALFKFGTVGKPVDCEVRIVNERGSDQPNGEPGELLIRGENIMKGYLDQPDLTNETILGGWLKTGDLATRDAQGFIKIAGRIKNVIVTGGINVQPQDVMDVVLAHNAVADAHVLGLPDPDFNQVVGCAVVAKEADVDIAKLIRELTRHCRAELAPHKVPRNICVIAELPRSAAGKVLSEQLRKSFEHFSHDFSEASALESVLKIAASAFRCKADDLNADATPFTVPGWDSLAHVNLISTVETQLNLSFTAADVIQVTSLGDLARIVQTELQKKPSIT